MRRVCPLLYCRNPLVPNLRILLSVIASGDDNGELGMSIKGYETRYEKCKGVVLVSCTKEDKEVIKKLGGQDGFLGLKWVEMEEKVYRVGLGLV
ncbi:hypothetical protein Tco_0393302 [Tanacetum coccineum]